MGKLDGTAALPRVRTAAAPLDSAGAGGGEGGSLPRCPWGGRRRPWGDSAGDGTALGLLGDRKAVLLGVTVGREVVFVWVSLNGPVGVGV